VYTGLNDSKMAGTDVEMWFHFPAICIACIYGCSLKQVKLGKLTLIWLPSAPSTLAS